MDNQLHKPEEEDSRNPAEDNKNVETENTGAALPQAPDYLDINKQYNQLMLFYEAGIRQMTTKLQILNREFEQSNDRNPIENIKSRIKSQESVINKLERKGLPMTLSSMTNNILILQESVSSVRLLPMYIRLHVCC